MRDIGSDAAALEGLGDGELSALLGADAALAEHAAELLRRRRMRSSLAGFAECIAIPGAPVRDDSGERFELWEGGPVTSLAEIDDLGSEVDAWARRKLDSAGADVGGGPNERDVEGLIEIAKGVRGEYGTLFARAGSRLPLHHRVLLDRVQATMEKRYGRLMVFMPPGAAKALALDTPIATPSGWSTMGDLRVGDEVFDEKGQPCRVIRKTDVFRNRPCYRVMTDCGDEIIADEDHDWRVCLDRKPRKELKSNGLGAPPRADRDDPASRFKVKKTRELARRRAKKPMIERAEAIMTPDADLPVHPYLLGLWLGDGNSDSGRMTCSPEDQAFIRAEIERLGYETTDHSEPTNFGVLGIRPILRDIGVLRYKHIPAVYLRSGISQRMDLLRGLIDSDGTVCRRRGVTTFCNTNPGLAEGVRELVRSLGVKAAWSESPAMLHGKNCGISYRVSFYMEGSALLPRKAELTKNRTRMPNTYVSVEPCEPCDTVCIEVDSPSHLFLAGRSMTPTHNSTMTTVVSSTWAMGVWAGLQIILASYATPLAKKHGGRARYVVDQDVYQRAFNCGLDPRSQAQELWKLTNRSEYMAGGLLSGLTGNRAGGVILDDPVKGREAAESRAQREKTAAAFEDDLSTRMIPGAWLILIQCLTGETPVLMADGSRKRIDDVRVGDYVLSHEEGRSVPARVAGQRLSGHDSVYKITTTCGKIVRGNERHPFLVQTPEGKQWVRLKDLRVGDSLVSLRAASGHRGRKRGRECAKAVKRRSCTTRKTLVLSDSLLALMESGLGLSVKKMAAKSLFRARAAARATTRAISGLLDIEAKARPTLLLAGSQRSKTGTESLGRNTKNWSRLKMACARFAERVLRTEAPVIGLGGWPLTTAMTPERSGGCSAVPATSPLAGWTRESALSQPFGISDFTRAKIQSIEPDGEESVYDLQIEGTENFIANGIVVHNTRWAFDDLAGGILPEDYAGQSGPVMCRDGMEWEVLNIPAKAKHADDPLGRQMGEYLWPEWFDNEFWKQYEPRPGDPHSPSERRWSSLFQQEPRPDSGNIFEEEWFERYKIGDHPPSLNYYFASDWATLDGDGDYTEHGVWGLDNQGHLWAVDWYFGQVQTDVGAERMCHLAKKWQMRLGFGEPGIIKNATAPIVADEKKRQQARFRIEYLPNAGTKAMRVASFQAMAHSGKVHIPDCPWGDRLIDQLCSFTGGDSGRLRKDDAVDVCSLIGRGLEDMRWSAGLVMREERKVGLTPFTWEWLTHGERKEAKVKRFSTD